MSSLADAPHADKERKSRTKLDAAQMQCIDGLRAVAVLLVVLLHYKTVFAGTHGVLAIFSTPGVVGVVLFFVISGLCITLSKSEQVTWGEFYIRRIFRLVPALWVGMALVFTADHFLLKKSISVQDIIGTALVLPQYLGSLLEVNPPLWSMQTEVELYLLFPFMLFLFFRLTKTQFVCVSLGVSVAAYAVWLTSYYGFDYYPPFPAFCHVIIWNSGLLLAYDTFRERSDEAKFTLGGALLLLLIGVVLLLTRNHTQNNEFAFWYLISGYGCYLLTKWALIATPKFLRHRVMGVVGRRSYSLYLLHLPAAYVCVALIHRRPLAFVVAILVTGIIVELLYRYVELPFITLGKRLTAHDLRPAAATQAEKTNEQATI